MANHKRKKSKRNVRCTMCTTDRWKGNGSDRKPIQEKRARLAGTSDED